VFEGDDGKFKGDVVASPDHRYDCSGIDGVSSARRSATDGKRYLTVAYGVYGNTKRTDNDHQVLLQYDITDWGRYASPLTEAAPHHNGPATPRASTSCAPATRATACRTWPMTRPSSAGSWASTRARSRPSPTTCCSPSRRAPSPCWATCRRAGSRRQGLGAGELMALADDGLKDAATGVRGWNQKADVGFQPVGHGLFYVSANAKIEGKQTADLTLMRWTGDAAEALRPGDGGRVTGDGRRSVLRHDLTTSRSGKLTVTIDARQALEPKRRRLAPTGPLRASAMSSQRMTDERRRQGKNTVVSAEHPAARIRAAGLAVARAPAGVDADDVIQEAYTILAELETVDAIRHPRAYLFQVARSVIMRHVRARGSSRSTPSTIWSGWSISTTRPRPSNIRSIATNLRQLAHAIAAMPLKTREAFVLRRVSGLPQREIAARMRISENTVETHISRGILFLIDWFGVAETSGPKPLGLRNRRLPR
jgi:RNA polymerase sigma factor (sigma-70 family)